MPRPLPLRRLVTQRLAIVTVLPAVVIAVLIWLVLLPQMRASVSLQQQSLARTVAGEIFVHLMGGERQLVALADVLVAEENLSEAQLNTLLDAGCGEGDLFETIYLVETADDKISHIGLARPNRFRRQDLLGIDLSGRDLPKIARQEVRTVWSRTFLSTVSSHLAVAVAVPLPGRVIIGEITLDRLSKYISQLPVEAELLILVIDRQGRIVADSQQKSWGQQLELTSLPPNGSEVSAELATRLLSLNGERMVASRVDVDRLGWKVLVAQSYATAYHPVRSMLLLVAAGLAIALMVSLALAWLMPKRLLDIVSVYTAHAASIANGKYDLKWPTARTIEYYELGENLRSMSKQIHQRERQLQENQRRLEELTANVPVVVYQYRVSHDHVYTGEFLSGKTIEIFGLEPNSTFIDIFYDHIPETEKDRYRASVRKAIDTVSAWNYEGRFIRPDGETIWFDGHAVPRKEGRDLVFYGVLLDITDRKQAEEAVSHLRNYLSNIINSMPSVLVGVDKEGRVTQWNKQAERVTGLTLAEVHQRPLKTVFRRLQDMTDQLETAIRDRRVIRKLKVPRRHADQHRYEDIIIFPLVANGVEGAVIRVDDVTERVRLEELMIQSEKMLSIGGLAAGMAHEINNPLAGILQNAEVLRNRLSADLPANRTAADAAGIRMDALTHYLELRKLPEMLAGIRDSGLRATTIVKNMLGFARKSDRTVSSHDICNLLERTIELVETDFDMKKRYDFKKIRINREYEAPDIYVPCEASKIQQVFLNLLKNGAEAMAENGASAPAAHKRETPMFTLRVKYDGDWVRVEVEDNGPGMDAKTCRSAFEPFFTTKPVGKGTGLGLSVSYFIITEDHDGEMEVQSSPGDGACFVIRLPKAGKRGASEV